VEKGGRSSRRGSSRALLYSRRYVGPAQLKRKVRLEHIGEPKRERATLTGARTSFGGRGGRKGKLKFEGKRLFAYFD